jgi:sugar lactone lactonase YvrE
MLGTGCAATAQHTTPTTIASPSPGTPSAAISPAPPALFDDPTAVAFDRAGRLWIANYRSDTLLGYDAGQLAHAAGTVHLVPALAVPTPGGPNQIAVDRRGWLWLADWDANTVSAYQPASLRPPAPAPVVVLSGPALGSPTDLAFDSSGNLWVANQATGRVVEIRAIDLARSGSPRPIASLLPGAAASGTPEAIAFDHTGRLWVSDYYRGVLMVVARSDLRGAGPVRPELQIDVGSRTFPIGLTFDADGRLWVSGEHVIEVFRPGAATAKDAIARWSGPRLVMPHDVSFDPKGDVWVPCYNDKVLRYPASALSAKPARPDLVLT